MGVPAIATSAGIGVTFGVSIVVSGATLGAGAIITLVVFISVEGIRNALWKRDTVATILEAKLMDALMSVNINLKIQKDFEQNLDELKKKLMVGSINNVNAMGTGDIKKYYYILKLNIEYDKVQECLDRIRDQALLFNPN